MGAILFRMHGSRIWPVNTFRVVLRPRLGHADWTIEWSVENVAQGLIDRSFATEAEAQAFADVLTAMEAAPDPKPKDNP